MVGHLKGAGVIPQCKRCYTLRNLRDEPRACPNCKALLNETTTEVRWLSLGDISEDARVLDVFVMATEEAMQGRGTVN